MSCFLWSGWRGSNSLPPPWQGGALPDELHPHKMNEPKDDSSMVPPVGIEPTTRGFSVLCSTNWATEANKKWRPGTGSNRRPLAWQASVLTNWTTGPPLGGNNRARTYDPLLVRQMLSQLSYAPMLRCRGVLLPTTIDTIHYWNEFVNINFGFFSNNFNIF